MTEVYQIHSPQSDNSAILRAAETLRRGGLVAFPTETVYGLGANALDAAAVARIFAAKGRPAINPLIVHVARVDQARAMAAEWPDAAEELARRFWPGPLTLVLPKRPSVPDIVTAGAATVGLRIPAHSVAQALLEVAEVPVAAPSANRSNEISPTTSGHVRKSLGDAVDVLLDGGPTPGGLESTVLDLSSHPRRLLRPGLIAPAEIEAFIGPIDRGPTVAPNSQPQRSPGQLPRHYAPRAAMECRAIDGAARAEQLAREGIRIGWLTQRGDDRPITGVTAITMPTSAADYAAQLYSALHTLDDLGVERIIVDLPPDSDDWLAIRDRLRRGSVQ